MDKTLWRNIIANDYVLPEQQSLADLTSTLLSYLGSTDPELRESIAYPILEKWIDRAYYSCIDLWNMAGRLLHNFTIGLGEEGTDTIFLRSFSILTLVDIIAYDLKHSCLDEAQVNQIQEQVFTYLLAEKDLRDYETGKGWMHNITLQAL